MAAPTLITGHFAMWFDANKGLSTTVSGATTTLLGSTMEGFVWRRSPMIQPIVMDEFGSIPIDGIHQGVENFVQLLGVEYAKLAVAIEALVGGPLPVFNAGNYGSNAAAWHNDMLALVGTEMVSGVDTNGSNSGAAGILTLVPFPGTKAAADIGAGNGIRFYRAIMDTDLETMLNTSLRVGPATFHCLPVLDPSDGKYGKCWEIVASPYTTGL